MNDRIEKLFNAMRCQLEVMAEYGDDENALKMELATCGDEILREYESIYL